MKRDLGRDRNVAGAGTCSAKLQSVIGPATKVLGTKRTGGPRTTHSGKVAGGLGPKRNIERRYIRREASECDGTGDQGQGDEAQWSRSSSQAAESVRIPRHIGIGHTTPETETSAS